MAMGRKVYDSEGHASQGVKLFLFGGAESMMMIAQRPLSFTFLPMNCRKPMDRASAL